jgi:hypothetical protein
MRRNPFDEWNEWLIVRLLSTASNSEWLRWSQLGTIDGADIMGLAELKDWTCLKESTLKL